MPPMLNPYTLMVLQWVVSRGVPVVVRRFAASTAMPPRFEGAATLERGAERLRGVLAVTDTHLLFTAHSRRTGTVPLSLPLASVEDVSPVRRRLLLLFPRAPNAIKVRASTGIYRFVVDSADLERWILEIRRAAFGGTTSE